MSDTSAADVPDTALDAGPDAGLEALLCFDLYAAHRAVTAAYRPILGELGLTYPQYLVLVALWEQGPSPIRVLAQSLRLDHATVGPLLRRMESAGLLTRTRSETDERSITVALAPRGEALRSQAPDVRCRVTAALGLDGGEVDQLRGLLRAVTAHLGE